MRKKSKAFTLAEVLITLGIIGIVAAMTIPTIMQNSQTQQAASMLKKEYSILSQAYNQAVQANGTPDNWNLIGSDSQDGAVNLLTTLQPYLLFSNFCGINSGCWPSTVRYKLLNGTNRSGTFDSGYNNMAKAQLADGTPFFTMIRDQNCAQVRGTSVELSNVCALIGLDINGSKPPNQEGIDFFQFYLTKYGIVPLGTQQETNNSFSATCQDKTTGAGYGCTAWAIYNENMDYLKCNNLSWDGPIKCP